MTAKAPTPEEVAKEIQDREVQDLLSVAATPEGRRFVWWVMSIAGLFANPFTGNSKTFYNCGAMEVGQRVFHRVMMADPDLFPKMQRENSDTMTEDTRALLHAQQRAAENEDGGMTQ